MVQSRANRCVLVLTGILIEILSLLAGLAIALFLPEFTSKVGALFTRGFESQCAILIGFPLGGLLLGIKTLHSLLHPGNMDNKMLYKWTEYRTLRLLGYVPLFAALSATIVSIVFLINPSEYSLFAMGAVYTMVTVAWIVSLSSLIMASLKIGAILGGEDS